MEVPINYLALVLCSVAAIAIGYAWYGPLFGKLWMRLTGLTPESMKAMKMTALTATIGGFITSFLMAYVLAHGIAFGNAYLNTAGVHGGMTAAFWYWLGFAVPMTAGAYLYEGKSVKLWFVYAGYYLVTLLVMGAIIGSF